MSQAPDFKTRRLVISLLAATTLTCGERGNSSLEGHLAWLEAIGDCGFGGQVAAAGERLWVEGDGGLYLVDVADPRRPKFREHLEAPFACECASCGHVVVGDHIVSGNWSQSLAVDGQRYDIPGLSSFRGMIPLSQNAIALQGSIDSEPALGAIRVKQEPLGFASKLFVDTGLYVIADEERLLATSGEQGSIRASIYDFQDVASPTLLTQVPLEPPSGLVAWQHIAIRDRDFIAAHLDPEEGQRGEATLAWHRFSSDYQDIEILATIEVPPQLPYPISIMGTRHMLFFEAGRIRVYKLSLDQNEILHLKNVPLRSIGDHASYFIDESRGLVYVAGTPGLQILDLGELTTGDPVWTSENE